jgi:hypothetical protein
MISDGVENNLTEPYLCWIDVILLPNNRMDVSNTMDHQILL